MCNILCYMCVCTSYVQEGKPAVNQGGHSSSSKCLKEKKGCTSDALPIKVSFKVSFTFKLWEWGQLPLAYRDTLK